ncbi:MAG TPA: ABC transporter substrate-binding protein [Burkholderiales bacterium]|nr:ABC transporter substrate-binding protein [Burkholderiales bacterium]
MSMKPGIVAALGLATVLAGLEARAAEPIRIGVVNEITGVQAQAGEYTLYGIRLAMEEINKAGGVLGRQLELQIEDNQSTNPGTVLAFSKLGSRKDIAGVIGPIRSTQIQAASPTIAKSGIPTMIGGTDTSLTHVNNRWLFRARPNDSYSSRTIADFGVNTLKARGWAIVHSTDAFGSGGSKALTEALKAQGVTPVLDQGYTNNSQDFTAIVLAVKKSGADVLATYMSMEPDVGIFARQLRQLGFSGTWIGSGSIIAVTSLKLAGEALHGTYSVADFTTDANDASRAFTRRYRDKYGVNPDTFASWSYDAMQILAMAIRNANSTDAEAVRGEILGIKGYKGLEGTYDFDQNGDGLHGYNIVKNNAGKIEFMKRVDFPVQ